MNTAAEPQLLPDWRALLTPGPEAGSATRTETLARLKEALAAAEAKLQYDFENGGRSTTLMPARAALYDRLIQELLTYARSDVFPAANPTTGELIAAAAVGGYGRGGLAPFSDLDLLFLHPHKLTAHGEQIVEYVLYFLWDLGLKVGHAVRSPADCVRLAKDDQTIATTLLESRFLWGQSRLFEEMRADFWEKSLGSSPTAFIEAKLEERNERHKRMGDTRYVLEPNIKEGKGGLRDLHTLAWVAKALYHVDTMTELVSRGILSPGEGRRFRKAETFLCDVRCHLHYLVGRAEERLTFDHQYALAERMGYNGRPGARSVERFMKHYFIVAKDVGDLTRILCAAFEEQHQRPSFFSLTRLLSFQKSVGPCMLSNGRLNLKNAAIFKEDPVNLLRLFHTAQAYKVDIHPEALRQVRRDLKLIDQVRDDPEANRLFLEMLTSPNNPIMTLRRLNEAGLLGRFLQPFGFVVAMMQYNMYHSYTVDEHTIRAIAELHKVLKGELAEEAPVATAVVRQVTHLRALFVAVLFHDIGKGRDVDHSILGAELVEEYGPRLGLSPAETETASWLVRHHLVLSDTAQRRDPNDPKTIQDFCQIVQSPDRLRQLLVLTVCDIRAVGPTTWTGWKAALLRDLYFRADEKLSGSSDVQSLPHRAAHVKEQLAERLAEMPEADRSLFIDNAPDTYLVAHEVDVLAAHAELLAQTAASNQKLAIEFQTDQERAATIVTICALDHAGLFSRLAGAMALAGANIVGARAFTLSNGYVIDSFWLQASNGTVYTDQERIKDRLDKVMAGKINLGEALQQAPVLRSRTAIFTVAPRVIIDNEASRYFTVIEVNGRDRPGFLNKVAYTMTRLGLQIASSHIATYGERAVDVFYVKDVFGLKVEHAGKKARIEAELIEAIKESNALLLPEAV